MIIRKHTFSYFRTWNFLKYGVYWSSNFEKHYDSSKNWKHGLYPKTSLIWSGNLHSKCWHACI